MHRTDVFREIVEHSPDAQLAVDPCGRILYANPYAHEMFGYEAGSLHGVSLEQLILDESRVTPVAHPPPYAAEPLIRGMGICGFSLEGLRRDGTRFPAEVRLAPVGSNSELLIAAIVRDATENVR